ncbi:MAG: flagellar hook capping FlgD N-terminal domain-containing protein [Pseudomonadota bacterium]
MEINQTNQSPIAQATSSVSTTAQESVISSDFETFLRMLTTQLENQDPLDPVKSEDFAVQLATFSGVEQQVLTNDLLKDLGAQMGLSGMGQFANWVGMDARAPIAGYFDGSPMTIAPEPIRTAERAVLVVQNASGTVVARTPISVSDDPIEWDGKGDNGTLEPGLYSFSVESYSKGQIASTDPVDVYARIVEAQLVDGATYFVTDGGVSVKATDVSAIKQG